MSDLEAILAINGNISKATAFNGIKLPRINPKPRAPAVKKAPTQKGDPCDDLRLKASKRTAPVPITIRGVSYPSVTSAAAELGISKATLFFHIRNKTIDRAGLGRRGMKYKKRSPKGE